MENIKKEINIDICKCYQFPLIKDNDRLTAYSWNELFKIIIREKIVILMGKISNSYSFFSYIKIAAFVLRSKLISPKIRIIRFPIEIRGKKWIDFGRNLTTGYWCRLEAIRSGRSNGTISFGSNVQINDFVHISALSSVRIGDNVLIASHV